MSAAAARVFPPVPEASATVSDLLLEGYSARFTLGYQASVEPFRAAVTALLADDQDPVAGLRWFGLGTAAAGSLWDDQATFDLSDRWEKMARAVSAVFRQYPGVEDGQQDARLLNRLPATAFGQLLFTTLTLI